MRVTSINCLKSPRASPLSRKLGSKQNLWKSCGPIYQMNSWPNNLGFFQTSVQSPKNLGPEKKWKRQMGCKANLGKYFIFMLRFDSYTTLSQMYNNFSHDDMMVVLVCGIYSYTRNCCVLINLTIFK